MAVIGIDPGITGAVAIVSRFGDLMDVEDIPVMMVGKGTGAVKRQIDAAGLSQLLRRFGLGIADDVLVVTEKVGAMPKQGVSSVFSLGDSSGVIRGVVAARGYPMQYVTPMTWKRHFAIGADKQEARAKAILLYPGAALTRAKDHNRAEAILIARFGVERLL